MGKSVQLFERLKQKSSYEKFMNDKKDAFLYAVFCIVHSNEKEGDKIQFDFYIPSEKKIAYAEYPFDCVKVQAEEANFNAQKVDLNQLNVDIEDLWEIVDTAQLEKKDNVIVNKIMGVLKQDNWELTCLSETLDILKIKINFKTKEVVEYKKENLMSVIQIRKK